MHEADSIHRAAAALANADALLICAGAGMGVDSGLPDFRGSEGFWNAYPAYRQLGLSFADLANPRWFRTDPEFAWGFYGHRLNLYRTTVPHAGFQILREWGEETRHGSFVFTSNVDGHFQRAGFADSQVAEVHGSIHHAQCLDDCGAGIFPAEDFSVKIDAESFRCTGGLPCCPACGGPARPNILMFGDGGWDGARSAVQSQRLAQWLGPLQGKIVIVEIGAGTAISTVRSFSEDVASRGGVLIRINVREPETPPYGISIQAPAVEALRTIDATIART